MTTTYGTQQIIRTKYAKDFKEMVLREALSGEVTVPELAKRYNLRPKTIEQWKYAYRKAHGLIQHRVTLIQEPRTEYVAAPSANTSVTPSTNTSAISADEYFKLVEENKHLRALLKLYMK